MWSETENSSVDAIRIFSFYVHNEISLTFTNFRTCLNCFLISLFSVYICLCVCVTNIKTGYSTAKFEIEVVGYKEIKWMEADIINLGVA